MIQEREIRRALGARQISRDLPSRVLEGFEPFGFGVLVDCYKSNVMS